jgi:hypothetical protein
MGFPQKKFQCDDGDVFFSSSFLVTFWRGATRDICKAITRWIHQSHLWCMACSFISLYCILYTTWISFSPSLVKRLWTKRNEPECRQWDKKGLSEREM